MMQARKFLIACYTFGAGGAGRQVEIAEHEPDTGRWTLLKDYADQGTIAESGVTQDPQSPSYLAWHPNGRYLYAVGEVPNGRIWAYEIDDRGYRLRVLGSSTSGGEHPCHLAVDPSGRVLVTANYTSGSLAVHQIRPDGSLGEPTDLVQHAGLRSAPGAATGPARPHGPLRQRHPAAGGRSRDGRGHFLHARPGQPADCSRPRRRSPTCRTDSARATWSRYPTIWWPSSAN